MAGEELCKPAGGNHDIYQLTAELWGRYFYSFTCWLWFYLLAVLFFFPPELVSRMLFCFLCFVLL